jgi:hypothetical protein
MRGRSHGPLSPASIVRPIAKLDGPIGRSAERSAILFRNRLRLFLGVLPFAGAPGALLLAAGVGSSEVVVLLLFFAGLAGVKLVLYSR